MQETLIISDCHGHDPSRFIRGFLDNDEERRVRLLGDYDDPRLVHNLTDLQEEYKNSEGINRIGILYGNHDFHLSSENEKETVTSGRLSGSMALMYKRDWANAKKEARDIFNNHSITDYDNGKNICYVHAGIDGHCRSDLETHIWTRMIQNKNGQIRPNEYNIKQNFVEMDTSGFDILFRGHDHLPFVIPASREDVRSSERLKLHLVSKKAKLRDDKKYIVCVGAFCNGHYAVYNQEEKEIDFKKRTLMDRVFSL